MEQEKIEGIHSEEIEEQLAQKGYLVLEKGTKYDLELIYTPSDQEPVYLNIRGRKIPQPKRSEYVTHPGLVLREPILVGRYVSHHKEGKREVYGFPLTNAKLLYLERESKEFQKGLIGAFGISEAYFGCEHPETLRDINMSLFASQNPHMAEKLNEIGDPYEDAITEEQDRINRDFVAYVLGEDVELEGLTAVRIVTEL